MQNSIFTHSKFHEHLKQWSAKHAGRICRASADGNELIIYGPIGGWYDEAGITDAEVATALASLDGTQPVNIRLNSPGGDVSQGFAIYNLLSQFPAKVNITVDGWAASAASVILMAGDRRIVSENSSVMIHCAWTVSMGNKMDLRKDADLLSHLDTQIAATYARRTGQSLRQIDQLLEAETWFDGKEAVKLGFADELIPLKGKSKADGSLALSQAERVPETIKNAATGFEDFPLSDRGHAWDATAADRRWRSHCSSDGSGTKEKMDWARYRNGHFWYDPANTESFGGYKLPFVDVLGGKPTAVWRGVTAVAQRLDATDIPTQDKDDVRHNVERYYEKAAKQYGDDSITAPWKNAFNESAYLRQRLAFLIG